MPIGTLGSVALGEAATILREHLSEKLRGDLESEMEEAFEAALKRSGEFPNKRIRQRKISRMPAALDRLIGDEDADPNVSERFIKKVLEHLRIEIAEREQLFRWVQQLQDENQKERLGQIQEELRLLQLPGYLSELLHRLQSSLHRPNIRNFIAGTYYRDDELHQRLNELLERRRRALLVGRPASGKTGLLTGIGYEHTESSPEATAFYVDAGRLTEGDWIKELRQHDEPGTLFLVDDAHKAPQEINELLRNWGALSNAHLLIASRPIPPGFASSTGRSYFDELDRARVEVDPGPDKIRKIATRLIRRSQAKDDARGSRELGEAEAVIKRCGGDLFVLRYMVKVLRENPARFDRLSDVTQDAVLESVRRKYLSSGSTTPSFRTTLVRVAALAQFEIPIEAGRLPGSEEVERAVSSGLLEAYDASRFGQERRFYRFFHSTPAFLVVESALAKTREHSPPDEFTLRVLSKYLEGQPINFPGVFSQLYQNGGEALQEALFDQGDVLEWFRDWSDRYGAEILHEERVSNNLWRFLTAVKNRDQAQARDLLRYWTDKIELSTWRDWMLEGSFKRVHFVELLCNIDENFFKNLIRSIDPERLGQQADLQTTTLPEMQTFFREVSRVNIPSGWVEAFVSQINMGELGERSEEYETGFPTVMTFIRDSWRAGVPISNIQAFCSALDFEALGERAREDEVGLATVQNFIKRSWSLDIPISNIQAFCSELDYEALGNQVREDEVGLATVVIFFKLHLQLDDLPKSKTQAFCSQLDFEALGERAREDEVGLATVMGFIRRCVTDDIPRPNVQAFCSELDFETLGEQAREDEVGLSTISKFIRYATAAGVPIPKTQDFSDEINFYALGDSVVRDDGSLKSLPPLFRMLLRGGTSKESARQFIEGIGWEVLRRNMTGSFSPDILAALRLTLTEKCEYDSEELRHRGLKWRPEVEWFRSFTTHPISSAYSGTDWHSDYAEHALKNGLLTGDVERLLDSTAMDLRSWSIWIHNIQMSDPGRLSDLVRPYLRRLDSDDYTKLFADSDLKSAGNFLNHFRPGSSLSNWELPSDIDFSQMDVEDLLESASIEDLSHFLFNFRYIDRSTWCRHFAKRIVNCESQLIKKLEQASLNELDFFFWNLWIALPEDQNLPLLTPERVGQLGEQASSTDEDNTALLGLAGTCSLAGGKWGEFENVVQPPVASRISKTYLSKNSPRAIRYLAGCVASAAIPPEKKDSICDDLSALDLTLDVPKTNRALSMLHDRLGCAPDA